MAGPKRTPGEGVEALEEAIQILRAGFDGEETVLDGPPEHWVETLARLTERLGLGAIILPAQSPERVERLVSEVVPGLRAATGVG
jgi:alkanesulfonate monooxygenase SsuD/methylene tetrahydromethanopterin reductase-like flavin-dependent oxidoreductase (luciferase family)